MKIISDSEITVSIVLCYRILYKKRCLNEIIAMQISCKNEFLFYIPALEISIQESALKDQMLMENPINYKGRDNNLFINVSVFILY